MSSHGIIFPWKLLSARWDKSTRTHTQWANVDTLHCDVLWDLLWDKHTQLNEREQREIKSSTKVLNAVCLRHCDGYHGKRMEVDTVNSWRASTFLRLCRNTVHRGFNNISGMQKLWKCESRLMVDLLQNFSAELTRVKTHRAIIKQRPAASSVYCFLVCGRTKAAWQEKPHYTVGLHNIIFIVFCCTYTDRALAVMHAHTKHILSAQ